MKPQCPEFIERMKVKLHFRRKSAIIIIYVFYHKNEVIGKWTKTYDSWIKELTVLEKIEKNSILKKRIKPNIKLK